MSRSSLAAMVVLCVSSPVRAEVLFQNPGSPAGWQSLFTQKAGTITEVSSPVYKGKTAMKTTQTYQTSDGKNYHSEMIKRMAQLAGQDLYYGHAVYLSPDWVFHNQNVTFQQWAPEMPEAPWILMYLQGDMIRLGGRGAMGDKDVGKITGLRGTWIRFVTRIQMSNPGTFEVWINGDKVFSQRWNLRAMGPSLRWSNGIYCTRWDTETPTGPRELTFFHDNMRIATTYEEADPASWSDGDAPAPGDAGTTGDAAPALPDAALAADAAGTGGTGGSATGGSSGRATGGTGGSAQGGAAGGPDDEPVMPPRGSAKSGGCQLGGSGAGGGAVLALLLPLLVRRRRNLSQGSVPGDTP
jgi:hypothetical protein